MDGTGSWDALDWTKFDEQPMSASVPHGVAELLMEAEEVLVQGIGVVLVNTDEAGTLYVTNFRLLLVSEGSRNIIGLGTIPLTVIEKFNKHFTFSCCLDDLILSRALANHFSAHDHEVDYVGKNILISEYGSRRKDTFDSQA
ncbi:hypothetical protein QJS04_geneDACA008373 [Acorus gramineus]|uniref:Uncharacterized protein n=1 Tax=Acorus gramineus TaxID=55184 RepID=A0AAV9AI68_ACOGR|nr:hypothetical protein QJS04_geneDACA008373 [Acorus gramineus]